MRLITLCLAFSCTIALPATAALQSLGQHAELVTRGTITDADGTVWNIRFVPGTRKINRDAVDGWKDAGHSMAELGGSELWADDVPEAFVDGFEFSRDVVVDHFAEGISTDIQTAIDRNRELRRGDFGRSFIVAWNWTKATGAMLCRTIWLPIGTAGGAVYSLTAPLALVLRRPVMSVGYASVSGMVTPTLSHLWNETAWGATFFSSVPERKTRWVKRQRAPSEYVVGLARVEAFLDAGVDEYLNAERVSIEQSRVEELQARISVLQIEQRAHREALEALQRELRRNAAVLAREPVRRGARGAQEVRLDEEARAWLGDDAAVDAAITAALRQRGRSPSEAEVTAIREAVERDVDITLRGR
jgi:hypothetical protein